MKREAEHMLNLLRISDTFFPLGSFTVSQAMEQLVADRLVAREDLAEILGLYLDKIWESSDLQVFISALDAVYAGDLGKLLDLDSFSYAAKLSEESRTAMVRMGANLAEAVPLPGSSLATDFRRCIREGKAHGMYPVVLAIVSGGLHLDEQGGLSLIYVNLMEVVASLVRMAEIDYLEAQQVMEEVIPRVDPRARGLADMHQSYPLIDIAAMRHEISQHRMFIS